MGIKPIPHIAAEPPNGTREVAGVRGHPGKYGILDSAHLPMAILEGAEQTVRYVNPSLCHLVGKAREKILGRPFAEMLPEGDECLLLLDRVYRTGQTESHTEQEDAEPHSLYWSYDIWPVQADCDHLAGVMIQVTETAPFHRRATAMNEALMVSAMRQHELTEEAETLNTKLQAEMTERKRAEEALAHNALHDALTNLPNRTLVLERVRHALALSQRHTSYKFAVLFIDLDEFKVFNDSLGHAAGDALLIQIARRLTVSIRGVDTMSRSVLTQGASPIASEASLARLGGDEFTILLEEIRDCGDAVRVAERIQGRLSIAFVVEGQKVVTTASIGIAFCATSYTNSEDVVRDAEIAMYRAKREGKARCQVFDSAMHTLAVKRLGLETDLRRALELGEFRVHYQPIVSLQSGKIVGFEALSRWQRPEGLLSPAHFIQIAEEIGIILPMNRLLLREACLQLRAWHSQFPCDPPLTMSVNITPKEFAQPDLAAQIGTILAEVGIHPSSVDVEITETIAMADPERSSLVLSELKTLGVHLSIDDFGTGYSSLSRLQGFRVDTLKIDRTFISKMDTNREIVRIIIMLAHNFGLRVVAEGAETAEQVSLLKQMKCELVQGYFFARPGDHTAAQALLMNTYKVKAPQSPTAAM